MPPSVPRLRAQRRRLAPPAGLWLLVLVAAAAALLLEVWLHRAAYAVARPARPLDAPFATSCAAPAVAAPRKDAVVVMLARNSERAQAQRSIESLERAFNRWFHYPILFLNDEAWDDEFVRQLSETSSGRAIFEVVPPGQWRFAPGTDVEAARKSIAAQGATDAPYAGREGYHHMCRFFSGNFYHLEALKQYTWYWRVEPGVAFSCAITYDPFVQMAHHGKVYGFVHALWEVGTTCPSLFRAAADWMAAQALPPTSLWKAMIEPSWVPWPFRRLLGFVAHRDRHGDAWSLCHYWSNFEIANLDFFRGRPYQDLFAHLDAQGGFYYERWGDAAVHSLAVTMLLEPHQVHHFDDIGYQHGTFYQCPVNARGGQLPDLALLGNATLPAGNPEEEGGVGCRCQCDRRAEGVRNYSGYCLSRLTQPSTAATPSSDRLLPEQSIPALRAFLAGALLCCFLLATRLVSPRWVGRIPFGSWINRLPRRENGMT